MTWVKGTTTWGNLTQDLTRLICGEIADSTSTTVASGDRWVREQTRTVTDAVLNGTTTMTSATAAFTAADVGSRVFGTGISGNTVINSVTNSTTVVLSATATSGTGVTVQICTDAIRTPASLDVNTGAISNRTGYFANISFSSASPGASTGVCRVTNPYTSTPASASLGRWTVQISVATANTVAGNYSTVFMSWVVQDADSSTLITSSNGSPSAAGLLTLPNGLQITISDPTGIVASGAAWRRSFTSTYLYGIDSWPTYSRRSGNATFSVSPPGTQGTDWDLVLQANANQNFVGERSTGFVGVGIKTATANTGALYTLSFPMAYAKGRIFNSTTVGTLGLDVGGLIVDTVSGNVMRVVNGIRTQFWAKPFQTAGSVTTSSAVQYWISVKGTGIALALQGDPGFSGKLCCAYFGDFTPYDTTYDVMPIMFNAFQSDYTTDNTGGDGAMNYEKGYWRMRRWQDGSEGRDWQTKWMRDDIGSGDQYALGQSSDISSGTQTFTAVGFNTNPVSIAYGYAPARQIKPVPIDGKWWFYGFQFADTSMLSSATIVQEYRLIRGYQNSRFLYLPGESWGSGDELTDTSTSQKYLLLMPDYLGMAGRLRGTTNQYYGGVAIAEV